GPLVRLAGNLPPPLQAVGDDVRGWLGGVPLAGVEAACDAVRSLLPDLRRVAEQVEAARALRARVDVERTAAAEAERAADKATAEEEERARRLEEARAAAEAARLAAAALPRLKAEADRAAAAAAAAVALPEAEQALAAVTEKAIAARGVSVEWGERHVRLLEQRLQGMAGELAAGLRPGDPCSVCGSTEHPQPAPPPLHRVTDAELTAAVKERTFAEEQADTLASAREAAQRRVEELRAVLVAFDGDPAEVTAALEETAMAAANGPALDAAVQALEAEQAESLRVALEAREEAARRTAVADQLDREAAAIEAEARAACGDGTDPALVVATGELLLDALEELRAAVGRQATAADRKEQASIQLSGQAQAFGFGSVAAASAALLADAERQALAERVEADRRARATAEAVLAEAEAAPDDEEEVPPLHNAEGELAEAGEALRAAGARATATRTTAGELERLVAQHAEAEAALAPVAREAERVRRLGEVCNGTGNERRMSLERYVLAARMEEITAAAGRRFQSMSDGRYTLRHSDERVKGGGASGLSIVVVDAWTGVERDVRTLSGGETFQASLALALAVVDVVQQHAGGVHIDALFVDEGFGTLDADALDQAVAELERLREGGRLVGIISHVAALHGRIPAGIEVVKAAAGSTVRVGTAA
ncbi:MAG TPA: SbcC/MukB-like Walker B domain-containing protein, partial [Acidimicrobiales bacterium]|nr:SbcC/MukB-like Walker B domain-containing protein [Acidimicrobiales bacterium]